MPWVYAPQTAYNIYSEIYMRGAGLHILRRMAVSRAMTEAKRIKRAQDQARP